MEQGRITPRRPTQQRFHTAPSSWDRQRVLDAFRAWAAEAGEPPKSYEWCPAAGRSAGLIGPAPTRWEKAHPRFPGNSTVYRFFDSWAEALAEAGFPVDTRKPIGTLAERVETAKRLRAEGESVRSIADHLQVRSSGTIYDYLRAGTCPACAGPLIGRDGAKLCHPCSTRKGNPRRWSEEEVLDLVNEWERLEGKPPTQLDWRPRRFGGSERWEREFPKWPPSGAAKLLFGGWNAMLGSAGLTPNHPNWEPAEIVDALQAYEREFGRTPAKQELEWPPVGYPSAKTVRKHFGSFTAGILAAGLTPRGARYKRRSG